MTKKRTGGLWNCLTAAYLAFTILAALEITVRLSGYSARNIYDPIYMPFDHSKEIPYVHRPNLRQVSARGLAVINTDSLGLRARIAGAKYGHKQVNEYRIAIVGDSFTFGEGVPRTDDTFAQVLEDGLNQRETGTVKVFNYGVSAYSVKEMAATLEHRMFEIEPDLVVMAIIPSDLNLNRTPIVDASGYLVDKRLSNLDHWMVGQVLRRIHLMYVLRDIGLIWFSKTHEVVTAISQGEIPESYGYIRQFKKLSEKRGVPYLIVLLPRSPWGSIPEQLERDGITHINLSSLLDEFSWDDYKANRFDTHPSVAVHHRIAEAVGTFLLDTPLFKKPV